MSGWLSESCPDLSPMQNQSDSLSHHMDMFKVTRLVVSQHSGFSIQCKPWSVQLRVIVIKLIHSCFNCCKTNSRFFTSLKWQAKALVKLTTGMNHLHLYKNTLQTNFYKQTTTKILRSQGQHDTLNVFSPKTDQLLLGLLHSVKICQVTSQFNL